MTLQHLSLTILAALLVGAGWLAWTGPSRIEARAVEAVAREQGHVAVQGAERLGAKISGITDRLTDPIIRGHVNGSQDRHVALSELVRKEDAERGVAWLIHDAEGHVLAASDPMLEHHVHAASHGSWASGADVCDMCFGEMGAVSLAAPLQDGTYLAANVNAASLASHTLAGLRSADGLARLIEADGATLFQDGPDPSGDIIHGDAKVPGTPWAVQVASPRSQLAPSVRADAILLLVQALMLMGMAAVGGALAVWLQRRSLMRELDAANTMAAEQKLATIGLLTAGVSHEMRNALSAAVGLVDLARHDSNGAIREDLEHAAMALERVADLSRDMTAFSRVDDHDPAEAIVVADTIREATRLLKAQLGNSKVDGSDATDTILAARGPVVQVLVNLLLNASQAMEGRSGGIRVSTSGCPAGVKICVDDEGGGVPVPLREKIFQPLFTTKPRGTGTGIGLWLSRRIAREQGGDLTVEDAPTGGARFVLTLPAVPAVPA